MGARKRGVIEEMQHEYFDCPTRQKRDEVVAYMESLGYRCRVYAHNPAGQDEWRVVCHITRLIADTERGDAVGYNGYRKIATEHPHRWPEDVPE